MCPASLLTMGRVILLLRLNPFAGGIMKRLWGIAAAMLGLALPLLAQSPNGVSTDQLRIIYSTLQLAGFEPLALTAVQACQIRMRSCARARAETTGDRTGRG